ncbi:hypothetical protein D3C85_1202650 [compost metagenome]
MLNDLLAFNWAEIGEMMAHDEVLDGWIVHIPIKLCKYLLRQVLAFRSMTTKMLSLAHAIKRPPTQGSPVSLCGLLQCPFKGDCQGVLQASRTQYRRRYRAHQSPILDMSKRSAAGLLKSAAHGQPLHVNYLGIKRPFLRVLNDQ